MKDVIHFNSFTDTLPQPVSWESVVGDMRDGSLCGKTASYRTLLADYDRAAASGDRAAADRLKAGMRRLKCSLPAIVCQVTLEGGKDRSCIRAYTGHMMVDFDHVPADRMMAAVSAVAADPCTFVSYVTVSGRGLRVIARVDGPVDGDNYRAAWLTVNEHYKRLTGLDYDTQCANPTRLCGLAHDPHAVYRPQARRIRIDTSMGGREARRGAGRPAKAANVARRVRLMVEADGAAYTDTRRNDYVSRCVYLMNRYGVTADDCTAWALGEFADYAARHPGTVESMVRSIYQTRASEHATLAADPSTRRAGIRDVEAFMSARYAFRRNLLSAKLEWRLKDGDWQEGQLVDDRMVNSVWRQMQLAGVNADLQTVNNILGSDFVSDYHPFRDWIGSLPPWDGTTDHIARFFGMVHCLDIPPELYRHYTHCWFLSMVASVMRPEAVNHCILTFIGRQGTYKSTFMLHILPPHLRQYFTTKSNSFQLTKDDSLMLAQNIIVSLEEIDAMTTKELNQLKAFSTMPQVNERPAYARHTVLMPRVASLTATGNNLTFLTDRTGNRRWLPFHVDSIDNPWEADIPYDGMYAQALALINGGGRYWLDDTDIRRLNEHNASFMAPDPAREMIVTYYMHPRTEAETKYMTATKIAARFAPLVIVSPTRVGAALAELGFGQVRTSKGRFWKVAERPQCEIDSRIPDNDNGGGPEPDMPF